MDDLRTNSNDPTNSDGKTGNNPPESTNTTNNDDTDTIKDQNLNENISYQQQNDSESNQNISSSVDRTENNTTNNSTQLDTNPTKPLSSNNKNDEDDQTMDTDPSSKQNSGSENDNHTDFTVNKQSSSQSNSAVLSFEEQRDDHSQNQKNLTHQNSQINPNIEPMNIEQNNTEEDQTSAHPVTYDLESPEVSHPPIVSNQTSTTSETSDDGIPKESDKPHWYDLQFHDKNCQNIKKPDEIEKNMDEPSDDEIDKNILSRIQGSIIGMAMGDALGAHVEFRPYEYLVQHPVEDLGSGGTWGLNKGQFTDDTSMALCLANSLIASHGFNPYDQLVRYKWWYKHGYMSSTGQCFDIGAATRQSIDEFQRRQKQSAKILKLKLDKMDYLSTSELTKDFNVYCSEDEVAGNGALMRLAPVPLFFYKDPVKAVEYAGFSGQITHGDKKAYDACRYYGALIVAALHGYNKNKLLDKEFYSKHQTWFGEVPLHDDIKEIAEGSYQKKDGYKDGIRGKGYIVKALEAALWAFWSDDESFEKGALAAVNLGDDTDTTAAIYGQLAGAYYGYEKLPKHWLEHVYARNFMEKLSKWIAFEGEHWQNQHESSATKS